MWRRKRKVRNSVALWHCVCATTTTITTSTEDWSSCAGNLHVGFIVVDVGRTCPHSDPYLFFQRTQTIRRFQIGRFARDTTTLHVAKVFEVAWRVFLGDLRSRCWPYGAATPTSQCGSPNWMETFAASPFPSRHCGRDCVTDTTCCALPLLLDIGLFWHFYCGEIDDNIWIYIYERFKIKYWFGYLWMY